jgi:hypothetical protein
VLQGERAASRASIALAGLLLGGCLLVSGTSRAEEGHRWLRWSAPAECQNTGEVERRVQSLLGRPVDVTALPPTLVRMGWSAERGWAVRVTVELAGGPRDRSLDAPSCADAFDLIALSLALIIDPDFGGAEASEPESARDVDTTPAPAEPVAPLSAVLPKPEPDATLSEAAAWADIPSVPDDLATRESAPASFSIGAAALADPWTFPVPQLGAGLQAAFGSGGLRIELEGDVLRSKRAELPGARYAVSFSSALGALRGCYGAKVTSSLGWLGCAGAELGSVQTQEHGGAELQARGLWIAAQALTGPELIITDGLSAFARFRAVTPLRRHELLLSEGSRVHELPWVSLQMQVGVAVVVTEVGGGGH